MPDTPEGTPSPKAGEGAPENEALAMEEKWLKFWGDEDVYRYDPESKKPVYSIDTPPPTVSGKMHIGHAYSYSQMDFVARYKRMRGYNLFYPFGFDDNGLPTERLTEREVGVKLADVGREEFIKKCLEVTKHFEGLMEQSWRRIGTSCDWNLVYRTIDPHAVKTSQSSFVELYEMDRAYRAERPSLWCPECATAIAQVEVEDAEKPSAYNYITFDLLDGAAKDGPLVEEQTTDDGKTKKVYHQGAEGKIVIATTRPELLPACVSIFIHPDHPDAGTLVGTKAKVPLFGQEVPVLASDRVDLEKGTGVVMCCTFGDQTDIDWWQEHNLPLRVAINEQGYVTELAPEYEGRKATEARDAMVADLKEEGKLLDRRDIKHVVGVHERCGTPIEFLVTKQWFVRYLDLKDKFLELGDRIDWHPEYMKVRYDNWVKGLKWDWCISRQRYFGVPFPVWHCEDCGETLVAKKEDLPVDPMSDPAPRACEGCGGSNLRGETDVMDTWATSSLTPQIALNWVEGGEDYDKAFPMSLRPQAHEIISFWAFNTIVKAWFHSEEIPWSDIMISGFVKLGKGKKMSKSKGNVIEPMEVIQEYSGDALRYWSATGANLGEDIIYNPKDLTRAQRLVTKLRNAVTFIGNAVGDEKPERPDDSELAVVDRWLLHEYSELVKRVTTAWDAFDYTKATKDAENFLWHVVADHYIELVKHRLYGDEPDKAARWTLYTVGLGTLKLFAPILCFITEDLYQNTFRKFEGDKSVHVAAWPEPVLDDENGHAQGELVKDAVAAVRNWKSENKLPLNTDLPPLEVVAEGKSRAALEAGVTDILGTTKAERLEFVSTDEVQLVPVAVKPVFAKIGPKYKQLAGKIKGALEKADPKDVTADGLKLNLGDETVQLDPEDYEVEKRPTLHGREVDELHVQDVTLLLQRP